MAHIKFTGIQITMTNKLREKKENFNADITKMENEREMAIH